MLLIKEVTELRAIVSANAQATNNEIDAVKSATLDNQAAIKSIGDDVDYIKQNYKRKWGKTSSSNTAFYYVLSHDKKLGK